MTGPNKPKFYITPGWKGLPRTNIVANWDHSYVTKKVIVQHMAPVVVTFSFQANSK
jgi:hypothetical protein